ncbi:MAG: type I restriction enzyme HsdR N-terminal domain-containing protein [Deltaproteobacteria bacterium]|nr:type I restriction enzyme HsdR N-terminal domain-containing protein [Deltaproteobacteria bacterium]
MFEPLQFEELNETDIREEVLAPLVRTLGYRSGTINNVIREQSLRYPRAFLGRKDVKKDPLLRGKADYILEASGKVRWVIEAKAPDVEIDIDAIEQAWSYANHAEIRAVYFVLSNGKTLQIFQTNQGPNSGPIFSITYEELEEKLLNIKNILSPEAILRDHPEVTPDLGVPLGSGLRSFVRITNGLIKYEDNSLGLRVLSELQTGIAEGAIERDEEGRMVAYVRTTGPSRSLQELNERLGLSTFEMVSHDSSISADQENPTVFIYRNTVILPAGEKLLDLNTWKSIILPVNISCHVVAEAHGFLDGHKLAGKFITRMNYIEAQMVVDMVGSFEVFLA